MLPVIHIITLVVHNKNICLESIKLFPSNTQTIGYLDFPDGREVFIFICIVVFISGNCLFILLMNSTFSVGPI